MISEKRTVNNKQDEDGDRRFEMWDMQIWNTIRQLADEIQNKKVEKYKNAKLEIIFYFLCNI